MIVATQNELEFIMNELEWHSNLCQRKLSCTSKNDSTKIKRERKFSFKKHIRLIVDSSAASRLPFSISRH